MTALFSAADAVAWTNAALLQGDGATSFGSVSIDSRTIEPGALFVAIAGPHHDGHDHLAGAVEKGAVGVVVGRGRALPALASTVVVLAVDDTTGALADLARGHRAGHPGPVVAITGSNGKTTTKEMCAAILSVGARCLKTAGNLNNEYGLPLTLLRRDERDRCLVVEIGMNHRGEIAHLAAIARPTVGVITNVGTAHVEHLGSRDEIALEKGDLVAGLGADATAVLNADDPRVLAQAERTAARVVRFGLAPDADVRAEGVTWRHDSLAFTLVAPEGRADVVVAGLGESTLPNALAASAAALAAGASLTDVSAGLAAYRGVPGRLDPIALPDGPFVIDDSYNANPQSMEVALRVLTRETGAPGRSIAVVGDMGELGTQAEAAHRATGSLAAELGVDLLYAIGSLSCHVAEGARAGGMSDARIHASEDWESVAEDLAKCLGPGDRVLVKGSRAMRMERIVERITASFGSAR